MNPAHKKNQGVGEGRGNRSRVIEGQFGAQLRPRGLWTPAINQSWHTDRLWPAKSLVLIVPFSTMLKQYDYDPLQMNESYFLESLMVISIAPYLKAALTGMV